MILINIGYLSSQIQQFKLRGNFKNDRFSLTSMLTSLKNCPKCLTQNLILCHSRLHKRKSSKNHNVYYLNHPAFKWCQRNKDINIYFYSFIYFIKIKTWKCIEVHGLFNTVELLLIPDCIFKIKTSHPVIRPLLVSSKGGLYSGILLHFCFYQKIGLDISCKLSPKEAICMKSQSLFCGKNKKNIISLSSESALRRW